MNQNEPYYDDEIDLKELAQTLWKGRWIILGLAIVFAVVALAFSYWVLPKKYESSTYVMINEPIVQVKNEGCIELLPTAPDVKSIAELVTSQSLLESVVATPEVAPYWDEETDSISGKFKSNVVGDNQIKLTVNDTDPERAAIIANAWAGQVAGKINELWGIQSVARLIDEQVTQAEENYQSAQSTLEKELEQNKTAVLEGQLDNMQQDLSCLLHKTSDVNRIQDDLQTLKNNINGLKSNSILSLGDTLSLITLQQRASASQICTGGTENLQIQIDSTTLEGITVSKALDIIQQMQDSLHSQQEQAKEERAALEASIPAAQTELENEKNRIDQYTEKRDQARDLYNTLLEEQRQIAVVLSKSPDIATVSAPAVPPNRKSSPKVVMNTAIGLIVGGMLGVFWVVVADWWREEQVEE